MTWLRDDLLDRVDRWRDGVALADVFRPEDGSAAWIGEQVERAAVLLDVQERVLATFGNVRITPEYTVSFIHDGEAYLAPHYDWGPAPLTVSPASAAIFAALKAPLVNTAELLKTLTAAAVTELTGPGQHNACFTHTGMTYANVHDSFEAGPATPIDLDHPSLLFFDHDGQVAGCGFFRSIDGSPHVFGSALEVLHDEWFVHVAGKHTDDGGFEPSESGGARHHDDFWDIHIWFSVDGAGSVNGIPMVGWTMAPRHLDSPPNVAHGASPGAVDNIICPAGMSSAGLYRDADDHHAH